MIISFVDPRLLLEIGLFQNEFPFFVFLAGLLSHNVFPPHGLLAFADVTEDVCRFVEAGPQLLALYLAFPYINPMLRWPYTLLNK